MFDWVENTLLAYENTDSSVLHYDQNFRFKRKSNIWSLSSKQVQAHKLTILIIEEGVKANSKLTIKTQTPRHVIVFIAFIVKLELIFYLVLVYLLLT